ncbi:unnamed protein product [Rotaria socialis]|uniref:Uncharacterized protein n=1 Tax=Rotaria socialis TaxID=392032 RepID=A0A820FGZ4_9BILA|nr:unnamed protein product [Rotaria socialis]
MQTEKSLRESEAAEYVYQLCFTLSYLHTKRVIYRDMFGEFYEYTDFGSLAENQQLFLIIGKSPFDSQTQHEAIRRIRSIQLTFPIETSSDLRDFITKLLHQNPTDQLPLKDADMLHSMFRY